MAAFFDKKEERQIINAIKEAEKNTSGEVRIHVEKTTKKLNTYQRALEVFGELSMHQTSQRNGVLFYFAIKEQKFAIIADENIYGKTPPGFWENLKDHISTRFRAGQTALGLTEAILATGQQMKRLFPYYNEDNENELSNEISTGD